MGTYPPPERFLRSLDRADGMHRRPFESATDRRRGPPPTATSSRGSNRRFEGIVGVEPLGRRVAELLPR